MGASAIRMRGRFAPHALACLMAGVLLLVAVAPADAQRPRISLIRDAEIEALIRDYARPLMKAGGLRRGSVNFRLVADNSFNAFVSGRSMYLNTGLLLQAETPEEVIGVMAHELGHIVGGHQIRLRQRVESAARFARVATLLGVGISAAGAAVGDGNLAGAGFGVASGGTTAAIRGILKYQRDEEASADRTAATLLRKSKISGAGMLETFKRLAGQLAIQAGRIDPYVQSHPLPNDRLALMGRVLQSSPYYNKRVSSNLRLRHDMMRAKVAAYVGGNRYARAVLADKRLHPQARLYGRAIITHLYGSPRKAIPIIEKLIKQQPRNAYVHEMKGEILLRSGKAAEAVRPLRTAVKLDKTGMGFLRVQLGHALIDSGNPKAAREAITHLRKGLASDPNSIEGYQYLGIAYGQLGDTANALLASAEFAIRTGKKAEAKSYARRAQQGLKRGSPGWLRAEDIVNYK